MLLNSTIQTIIIILQEVEKGNGAPVRGIDIVNKHDLSPHYVDQICRKLRMSGYIKSLRGPGGGYVLNKKDISLLKITEDFGMWKSTVEREATRDIVNQVESALGSIRIV